MSFPATSCSWLLRAEPPSPASQCIQCFTLRAMLPHHPRRCDVASFSKSGSSAKSRTSRFPALTFRQRRRRIGFCRAMTETEPDGNDEKEKVASGEDTSTPEVEEDIERVDSIIKEDKIQIGNSEYLEPQAMLKDNEGDLVSQNSNQNDDDELVVARGSPLPGMKQQLDEIIKIPKATIDVMKDYIFGFDTFFVTSQEPYEGGVLFKGNLRGKANKSYEKITKRMQDKFGDQYKLFLLINPEDDKPVAVVIPKRTLQPETRAVPEWLAASAFGLVTIFTLLLRNVPALQSNLFSAFDNIELLKDGLPGALVTALILGFHEIGHIFVARESGIKLGVPYFVPSGQIGSFGAITRIINIVSNRENLLKFSAAGPLAGFSAGFALLLLGFVLPPGDGLGIIIDPAVFHESLLVGGIAKLFLGEALKEGTSLSVNPLVLWSWAGLLINAINSIPAGELDGGRISFALFGRKGSSRLSGITLALLGVSSLVSDVAFYWTVLIFFLQRGPIAPLSEEITEPENKYIGIGIAILLLGLLICLPYPFPFASEVVNIEF